MSDPKDAGVSRGDHELEDSDLENVSGGLGPSAPTSSISSRLGDGSVRASLGDGSVVPSPTKIVGDPHE